MTVKKYRHWLLPVLLILFMLEAVSMPLVMQLTYAGRSDSPDHILTYTPGKLVWDSNTNISADGVAELSLFDAQYDDTVIADDGQKVVAPGTDGFNMVRLKNDAGKTVQYIAVLYEIKSDPFLPVESELDGIDFTDTENYPLPDSAKDAKVIRAVTGSLESGRIQDFDINWLWKFYKDDVQDIKDTVFGNKAADGQADEITVGFYLVVEDNNSYIDDNDDDDPDDTPDDKPDDKPKNNYVKPEKGPDTGDHSMMGMYMTLMGISCVMLILLLAARRKEKRACGQ